jgi:hypothetical protein
MTSLAATAPLGYRPVLQQRMAMMSDEKITQVFGIGEYFAFDGGNYEDGDVIYGQVLEVVRSFGPNVNSVGVGKGGCKVRVHCERDEAQDTPDGVEDYYGHDFVDRAFIRLTRSQMEAARQAGWPSRRSFLHLLGAL